MYIDEERRAFFDSRIEKEAGHCIWTGTKTDRGYAKMIVEGKVYYAHKIAYAIKHNLTLSEIDKLKIMKTCERNDCVNPAHLAAKPKKT